MSLGCCSGLGSGRPERLRRRPAHGLGERAARRWAELCAPGWQRRRNRVSVSVRGRDEGDLKDGAAGEEMKRSEQRRETTGVRREGGEEKVL